MSTVSFLLVAAGFATFIIGTIRHGMEITLADVVGNALQAAGWAISGAVPLTAFFAFTAALSAWFWWHRNRRSRKRAAEAIGAKSRALRDAITRKARELSWPSPVLRPSLGGAS